MSEAVFARQFLTLLDSKPTKLSSDYVLDPRNLPAQSPYILPRMPKPLSKRSQPTNATSTSTHSAGFTVTLKPIRQPPAPITLKSIASQTSIYDIKTQCAAQTGYVPEKVKILWERKPVVDSKTVAEVVGVERSQEGAEVEFGVMFVGAPTKEPAKPGDEVQGSAVGSGKEDVEMKDEAPVAQGQSGQEVVETKEFWDDLRGFLLQRVKDEDVAAELHRKFRESWRTG